MGYRTIMRVPENVRTYERAKEIHDNVTPIRGRIPEVRPLGARRDADEYRVRMAGDVVEFTLFDNRPVIRYYPDGTIGIKQGNYSPLSTQELLYQVLKINSRSRRRSLIVEIDGKKVVLGKLNDSDEIRLKYDSNKQVLTFVSPTEAYGYAVNKKRMKEVRGMHSDFIKYMKGFISLRKHEVVLNQGTRWARPVEVIGFTTQELLDCFKPKILFSKVIPDGGVSAFINMREESFYLNLPGELRTTNEAKKEYMHRYEQQTGKFIAMTKNEQAEDDKHNNFHKAAMMLLGKEMGMVRANPEDLTTVSTTKADGVMEDYDEVLKRWYRNTILEKIQLTNGKSPNMLYEQWMEEL